VRDRQKGSVQPMVRKNVQAGSALYSDEMGGYKGLQGEYQHQVLTMPCNMWMAAYTLIPLRTSGRC